jgi:hypothetical protein
MHANVPEEDGNAFVASTAWKKELISQLFLRVEGLKAETTSTTRPECPGNGRNSFLGLVAVVN